MCNFLITVCVSAGEDVRTVQKEVADILKGRIVVGHAIHNDLKVELMEDIVKLTNKNIAVGVLVK